MSWYKKSQEDNFICFDCGTDLDIDDPGRRDTESMSGVPVEYYICPKCGAKYEDVRFLKEPPNLDQIEEGTVQRTQTEIQFENGNPPLPDTRVGVINEIKQYHYTYITAAFDIVGQGARIIGKLTSYQLRELLHKCPDKMLVAMLKIMRKRFPKI